MSTNHEPLWDGLITGVTLATLEADAGYGAIEDAALGWREGVITYAGARSQLPGAASTLAREAIEAEGGWITPGLIDCHTHTVFAGDRAGEFVSVEIYSPLFGGTLRANLFRAGDDGSAWGLHTNPPSKKRKED